MKNLRCTSFLSLLLFRNFLQLAFGELLFKPIKLQAGKNDSSPAWTEQKHKTRMRLEQGHFHSRSQGLLLFLMQEIEGSGVENGALWGRLDRVNDKRPIVSYHGFIYYYIFKDPLKELCDGWHIFKKLAQIFKVHRFPFL